MTDVSRSQVDPSDVKRMPVAEFADGGYLQEVNRRLLHPLGLALEVERALQPTRVLLLTDDACQALRLLIRRVRLDPSQAAAMDGLEGLLDASELLQPGDARLSGIWDCRDDAEGVVFGPGVIDPDKAHRVTDEINIRSLARMAALGYLIQDVGESAKPDAPPENPSNRGA